MKLKNNFLIALMAIGMSGAPVMDRSELRINTLLDAYNRDPYQLATALAASQYQATENIECARCLRDRLNELQASERQAHEIYCTELAAARQQETSVATMYTETQTSSTTNEVQDVQNQPESTEDRLARSESAAIEAGGDIIIKQLECALADSQKWKGIFIEKSNKLKQELKREWSKTSEQEVQIQRLKASAFAAGLKEVQLENAVADLMELVKRERKNNAQSELAGSKGEPSAAGRRKSDQVRNSKRITRSDEQAESTHPEIEATIAELRIELAEARRLNTASLTEEAQSKEDKPGRKQQKLKGSQPDSDQITAKLRQSEQRCDKSDAECKQLRSEYNAAEAGMERMRPDAENVGRLKSRVEELEAALGQSNAALRLSSEEYEEQQRLSEYSDEHRGRLKEEIARLQESESALRNGFAAIQSSLSRTQQNLAAMAQDREDMKLQLTQAHEKAARFSESEENCNELRHELRELVTALRNSESMNDELKAQATQRTSDLGNKASALSVELATQRRSEQTEMMHMGSQVPVVPYLCSPELLKYLIEQSTPLPYAIAGHWIATNSQPTQDTSKEDVRSDSVCNLDIVRT